MHGLPIWRATTAAWDVAPPLAVRMPCGDGHAGEVVGGGLVADEDDLLAALGPRDRVLVVEHGAPDGGARRGVEALDEQVGALQRALVELVAQELVDVGRLDPAEGLLLRDDPLLDHVEGDLHGRRRGPLRDARLEHVELAALDRELEVLDVAVVLLELLADLHELVVRLGHLLLRAAAMSFGVRMPATTSSPWAFVRYSPWSSRSPLIVFRVNATPVPESSPMFPKTIVTTLTAVPRSWAIFWLRGSRGRARRTTTRTRP